MRTRRWEFETCGCLAPKNEVVQECHSKQGILVSYKQENLLTLSVDAEVFKGAEATGRRFNNLNEAACRLTYSGQTIKQTCKCISQEPDGSL